MSWLVTGALRGSKPQLKVPDTAGRWFIIIVDLGSQILHTNICVVNRQVANCKLLVSNFDADVP